jgi:ABC-type Zn uptake system ZnuABC Zn-binding protein ZnuA
MRRLRLIGSAVATGLTCGLLLVLTSCERKPAEVWPDRPGPKVLTSFAPIQCFAINVAGDDAVVMTLMTTKGPHETGDTSEQHLKLAAKCDVLFINGLGIDDKLSEKIKLSVKPDLNIFALGARLGEADLLEGECKHEGHKAGEKHTHPTDPHVWLGPKQAKKMGAMIRDELTRIDPSHGEGYARRAAAYTARLDQLERDGKEMLKGKTEKQILTHHDSMQYFTDSFGLVIAGYVTSEGIEPGSERLSKIIADCKTYSCRIIGVEPQYPRNSAAETILRSLKRAGVDAEFVEVDPMETADENDLTADFYERKMRQNLKNLANALR